MAHNTDKVGFPQIPLRGGMTLQLDALDPTADAEVAGVTSTRWAIYGSDDGAPQATPDTSPILVVPLEGSV